MNKVFVQGFCLGVILKDKLLKTLQTLIFNGIETFYKLNTKVIKTVRENKISNIYFICSIENEELFQETFAGKFQHGWKYFPEKKSLKITLDEDTLDHFYNSDSVNTFYNISDASGDHVLTLDIPLFESFGKNYLFVEYFFNNQKYINVYTKESEIHKEDFVIERDHLLFDDVLCSSIKIKNVNHYITNLLKLFSNNKRIDITPELVLLFHDEVNIDLKHLNLIVICNKAIFNYSYNDKLK